MEILLLPMLLLAGLLTTMDVGDDSPLEDTDAAPSEGSGADQEFVEADFLDIEEHETVTAQTEESNSFTQVSSDEDTTDPDRLLADPENQTIVSDELDEVTVSGGLGADRFILSDLIGTVEEAFAESPRRMVISDFDTDEDILGVVIETENIEGISISTDFDPESNATEVLVNQDFAGDKPSTGLIASFRLEGIDHFDASNVKFFLGDELTPLEFDLVGSNEDEVACSSFFARL